MATQDLGFPHLIDELSNALNPASGLPRNLQLTPEAVKNMSMEKAVRLVSDINAHRAAQKIEANRKLAEQASIVREYAENNPRGLRWVELKAGDLPEGWKVAEKAGNTNYPYQDPEGIWRTAQEAPHVAALADQLKYEGDTMGHCVGGYCDDVLSGRSRIFSLRDAKGEPHVTVEVRPPSEKLPNPPDDVYAMASKQAEEAQKSFANSAYAPSWGELVYDSPAYREWLAGYKPPPSIAQIKGKQNRAPNPEYLPFVQDFVRNSPLGGQWGDVGDLHNTGLQRAGWSKEVLEQLKNYGIPAPEYGTIEEINAALNALNKAKGFAHGGSVQKSNPTSDFQAMIAALEQELAHAAG